MAGKSCARRTRQLTTLPPQEAKSRQDVGLVYRTPSSLMPSSCHLQILQVPHPSEKAGDQIFKHTSPWEAFHINTEAGLLWLQGQVETVKHSAGSALILLAFPCWNICPTSESPMEWELVLDLVSQCSENIRGPDAQAQEDRE